MALTGGEWEFEQSLHQKAWHTLTPRELQVALLFCRDLRTSEVAASVGISIRTVDTHRAKVLAKLGANTTTGILRSALIAQRFHLND